jgi:two-component system phosphate regulon response regulator PhoB
MATQPDAATILIVDDDPVVAALFQRTLLNGGFRVLVTTSAQDALTELDQRRPHAVILDLRMPFIDGLGLLYRIRSREAQQHLPVLVVTGDTTLGDDTRTELTTLGAKVLFKPIDGTQLLAETRALLGIVGP